MMRTQPADRGASPSSADHVDCDDPQALEDACAYLDCRSRGLEAGRDLVEAWDRFYRDQTPYIRAVVRAYRDPAVDPEDALQEVWSSLITRLGRHRHDGCRGPFRAWLFVVARHRLSDLGRQATRRGLARLPPEVACTFGRG